MGVAAVRRRWVLMGGLPGALLGVGVGWFVLRPSDGDLLAAARELVPEGFAVVGDGVEGGQLLPGWPGRAGVHALAPDVAWDDVDLLARAEAAGWNLDRVTDEDDGWEVQLRRIGMVADLDLSPFALAGVDGAALLDEPPAGEPGELGEPGGAGPVVVGSDLVVDVRRDGSAGLVVGLAALVGALAGALVGGVTAAGTAARGRRIPGPGGEPVR